jgi:Zn-finger nucleic acid-binding protein
MICPKCKKPVVVLELQQVEIDHCLSCGGVWLDHGELELLMGKEKLPEDSFSPPGKTDLGKEKRLRCPICRKKMEKLMYDRKVLLDVCKRGHGIWFDRDELYAVVRSGSMDPADKVLVLLQEMLGYHIGGVRDTQTSSPTLLQAGEGGETG